MSRTFRRDDSGRKSQDTRRAKRREKANSHYSDTIEDYKNWCDHQGKKVNRYDPEWGLDTDSD